MAAFSKKNPSRAPQTRSQRTPINTYYRSKEKSSNSPFVKKPAKKPVRKFILVFLDLIILAILVLGLLYSLALKASPVVEANDFSYHTKATYAAAGRVQFGRFQNRNKLTFNETSVIKALQSRFPEISAAQVELPFFSEQPVLHLTVAEPSFILSSSKSSLIVDSAGVAVGPAASFPIKGLPYVIDDSGYIAKAGSQVMGSDAVDFINSVMNQCRRAKIPIASLVLPAQPQELQLRTKDSGYYVKFYLGGDALQETGQFLAARHHFSQIHQPPSQYLDVRVSGKIFYK